MKSMTRGFLLATAVLALAVGVTGQARAGVLLDLENPADQSDTPFALSFTATAGATTVAFAGYQVPAWEQVTNIDFSLTGGGSNLLGGIWNYTPAPSGSLSNTYDDGTSVPALNFGGVVVGSFDTYSQTVATVAGQSYTLSFLFSNSYDPPDNAPSEFVVSTDANTAVPEPSTLAGAGIAVFLSLAAAWRRRKAKHAA